MDTMQVDGGRAVAVPMPNNTSRISTRSTRRKKGSILSPKKMIEFVLAKHPSKTFEAGLSEIYKECVVEFHSFFNYFKQSNREKNISKNIWLYDSTRVIVPDVEYYHASFVEGSRPKQYILAQAPFNSSQQKDFFKMLVHVKCEVLIIVDACEEATTYTVKTKDEKAMVKPSQEKSVDELTVLQMNVSGLKDMKVLKWNRWDSKTPTESDFLEVQERIRKMIGWNQKTPIVLVCKDGVTKCGVFVLLDMECERYKDKGKIKITDSIKAIRNQRSHTFESLENFELACNIIVELCKKSVGAGGNKR